MPKQIIDWKYTRREKVMTEFLDNEYANRIHEGTGCAYILSNLSQRKNLQFSLMAAQEVIDSYTPEDSETIADPKKDCQYLVLPLSAMVRYDNKLREVGYDLYHIDGVGLV